MATIADIFTVARDVLQDARPGVLPRHSTAKLSRYLTQAMSDAKRLRPDLFLPDVTTKTFFYTGSDADLALEFPIDFEYHPPFIEYITGMVSLEEDEYVEDGRAAALLARFAAKMVSRNM